jgi:hypothetical protein
MALARSVRFSGAGAKTNDGGSLNPGVKE